MKVKKAAKRVEKESSVIRGAKQALAFIRGEGTARVTTFSIAEGSVKEIRKHLNLSQSEFAKQFGFTTATVRNWEQGRYELDTSTKVLLTVIRQHPDIVRDAVEQLSK